MCSIFKQDELDELDDDLDDEDFEQFKQLRMMEMQKQAQPRFWLFVCSFDDSREQLDWIALICFVVRWFMRDDSEILLLFKQTIFWSSGGGHSVPVANYIEKAEDAPDTHTIVVHVYQPVRLVWNSLLTGCHVCGWWKVYLHAMMTLGVLFWLASKFTQNVEACVRMNFALMDIAEQFPYVRFMRGICTDLIPSFDEYDLQRNVSWEICLVIFLLLNLKCSNSHTEWMEKYFRIGLPTLMIYHGGKKQHILVRVHDEIGANVSDRDLVLFLAKCVSISLLDYECLDFCISGDVRYGALSDANVDDYYLNKSSSSASSSSSSSGGSSSLKFSWVRRGSDED